MDQKYTIEEILSAVNEFQEVDDGKILKKSKDNKIIDNIDIPSNTLKLIEEAEKAKN
tara:strand:+ start:2157 stop:2327 length:171 start_codon:yes stop_codon:yes gene_type:complete